MASTFKIKRTGLGSMIVLSSTAVMAIAQPSYSTAQQVFGQTAASKPASASTSHAQPTSTAGQEAAAASKTADGKSATSAAAQKAAMETFLSCMSKAVSQHRKEPQAQAKAKQACSVYESALAK